MIPVKLDADKKFKWPDFKGLQTALSQEENKSLLQDVSKNYQNILDSTLSYLKFPTCSGRVGMITTVEVDNNRKNDTPLFGVYKSENLNPTIDSYLTISEDSRKYIKDLIKTLKINEKVSTSADLQAIKDKYRECLSNDLFIINLTVFPLYYTTNYAGHQNILVISKARGVIYWIEPQSTVDETYETSMIKSIKKLVTEIGMINPTVINPVETCPQAIAGDQNCMFWAYIILFLILLNPQERDHNALIKKFMEKYPTKEVLTSYINGLKLFMSDPEKYKTTAGKRRKTRRLKKNRRTMRRR